MLRPARASSRVTPILQRVTGWHYASEACPYCAGRLDPLPKAKKRCPSCGRPIYVRPGPDGLTYLLQTADLPVLEAAWAEHRQQQQYVTRATAAGVDFAALEAELLARNAAYTARDVYWAGMNKTVLGALKRADWQTAKMTYFQMALMAWDESGEDIAPGRALALQRSSDLMELNGLLEAALVSRNGVPDVRVGILGCDCETCRAGPHERLWARDELITPHIPHIGCRKGGWCACEYVIDLS